MKQVFLLFFIITLAKPAYSQDIVSIPQNNQHGLEKGSYRFEIDNDLLFGKDSGVTSGLSVHLHSPIAESWINLQGTPDFVGRWGARIPMLNNGALFKRAGIAIGQIIQTPTDLSRTDLILGDVPYAGALTIQATWYAFNNNQFRGFQTTLGIVGPSSLAENTQEFIHEITGSHKPQGWKNQISDEPIFNLSLMSKKKLWKKGNPPDLSYDSSVSGNIVLGNMFTQAIASVETRFGYNMPGGFIKILDPIGYSMQYDAALAPAIKNKAAYYGSFVVRGVAVAHNIFLDGNTSKDSHRVEKEPLVGQVILGFHYERPDWSIHFNMLYTTDTVDTNLVTEAKGNEMFGNLIIEWRI